MQKPMQKLTQTLIHATAHRLVRPALLFLVCAATLVAVSVSIWAGPASCSDALGSQLATSSVRAYIVPSIKSKTSSDGLTVTIQLMSEGGGGSLLEDVRSGLVDTLILGGTAWLAASGPDGLSLLLATRVAPSCPVRVLTSDHATWATGWAQTGASALVLAFRDIGVGAA